MPCMAAENSISWENCEPHQALASGWPGDCVATGSD